MDRVSPSLALTDRGLFCPKGDFAVDPVRPVETAVITHAHSDHARPGSANYICAHECLPILRARLGPAASIRAVPWREPVQLGATRVSFHPAAHVRGSAQIRIESRDEVAVVTGDFKREPDPTTEPFESVPCDTLVTESTFAMPIYRWRPTHDTITDIAHWWHAAAERGVPAVLFCYALGKSQRVLAELAALASRDPRFAWIATHERPILIHGAVAPLVDAYEAAGVALAPTHRVSDVAPSSRRITDAAPDLPGVARVHPTAPAGALVIAPPSAAGTPWMRRFGTDPATAFASGWMHVRGMRRRRGFDRGFVLSDHADWPGLIATVHQSRASRVLITHGYADILARFLREQGVDAHSLAHAFVGQFGENEHGDQPAAESPITPEDA